MSYGEHCDSGNGADCKDMEWLRPLMEQHKVISKDVEGNSEGNQWWQSTCAPSMPFLTVRPPPRPVMSTHQVAAYFSGHEHDMQVGEVLLAAFAPKNVDSITLGMSLYCSLYCSSYCSLYCSSTYHSAGVNDCHCHISHVHTCAEQYFEHSSGGLHTVSYVVSGAGSDVRAGEFDGLHPKVWRGSKG